MRKEWVSTAIYAVMIAGSPAGRGPKTLDTLTTAIAATTRTATTTAKNRDADITAKATADTSDMPEIILIMAEINPLDTAIGRTDSRFRETVEGSSGGKIRIGL